MGSECRQDLAWNALPPPQATGRAEHGGPRRLLWGSCRDNCAGWGLSSSLCSDSHIGQGSGASAHAWRQLAVGDLELDCSHCSGGFAPMYPFYLFITYKLGVRLTLLKANKAGQRMGPPDRAAGVWGGEAQEIRGGLWLQQWRGPEVEGQGRGFPAGFSVSRDPTTFMAVYILLKLCQHGLASRLNSRL